MILYFEFYDRQSGKSIKSDLFPFYITNSFTPHNLWIVARNSDDMGDFADFFDETADEDRKTHQIEQVLSGYITHNDIKIYMNGFVYIEEHLGSIEFVLNGYTSYKDDEKYDGIVLQPYPNIYNVNKWKVVKKCRPM